MKTLNATASAERVGSIGRPLAIHLTTKRAASTLDSEIAKMVFGNAKTSDCAAEKVTGIVIAPSATTPNAVVSAKTEIRRDLACAAVMAAGENGGVDNRI